MSGPTRADPGRESGAGVSACGGDSTASVPEPDDRRALLVSRNPELAALALVEALGGAVMAGRWLTACLRALDREGRR